MNSFEWVDEGALFIFIFFVTFFDSHFKMAKLLMITGTTSVWTKLYTTLHSARYPSRWAYFLWMHPLIHRYYFLQCLKLFINNTLALDKRKLFANSLCDLWSFTYWLLYQCVTDHVRLCTAYYAAKVLYILYEYIWMNFYYLSIIRWNESFFWISYYAVQCTTKYYKIIIYWWYIWGGYIHRFFSKNFFVCLFFTSLHMYFLLYLLFFF